MKKKSFGLGTVVLACLIAGTWSGSVIAGNTLSAPEDELVIEGKKPARFSHPVHLGLGIECGACHHDAEHKPLDREAIAALGKSSQLKCVTCHNSEHPDKELQKAKDIFHARCQTCHKAGYEGKNGPTKCTGCHITAGKKSMEGC